MHNTHTDTDRQTDSDRQTDRQTERQTDTGTGTDTDTDTQLRAPFAAAAVASCVQAAADAPCGPAFSQHTSAYAFQSAYVSIRLLSVSIRQHMLLLMRRMLDKPWQARQRQYLYFCTSKANKLDCRFEKLCCPSTSAYVSIRQHTPAYVSIRCRFEEPRHAAPQASVFVLFYY
jgi:hypothetical protein